MSDRNTNSRNVGMRHTLSKSPQNISIQRALEIASQIHIAGNLTKAKDLYRQILQVEPNHPIALHLLGVVAYQTGSFDIAEESIVKAIKLKPDFDEAYNNLGNVYKSIGRFQDAVIQYQHAIKLKPQSAEPHYNLAIAYELLGKSDDAVKHYQRAIDNNPSVAATYFNLANVYRGIGKLDDAVSHYRKAISIQPTYAEAYRQISRLKKYRGHDEDIKAMEQVIARPDITPQQKMHLAFGLGKAFEDLKQYQRSFEFVEQANRLKRADFNFDIKDWERFITRQIDIFTIDLFEKHLHTGYSDKTPIFILGMPRSGSSLVEQILASHPDVYGAGEVQILSGLISKTFDMNAFPENIVPATADIFNSLGESYLHSMRDKVGADAITTNKMLDNFKLIGMIKLMLPNAKIIHCVRDPMDNCFSIFKNYFSSNDLKYAYDQVELAIYYKGYEKLMKHWRSVLPNFVYDIQYENIVADLESQTRALLEYCDLDWDDRCIMFHKTERKVKTASAAQVRQPVYKGSVQLWKRYQEQLTPLLEHLKIK